MEKTAKKIITTNKNLICKKEREFKNFYDLIQFYGFRKGTQNNITSYGMQLMKENIIHYITIIYNDKTERNLYFEFYLKTKDCKIVVCDIDYKRGITKHVYY